MLFNCHARAYLLNNYVCSSKAVGWAVSVPIVVIIMAVATVVVVVLVFKYRIKRNRVRTTKNVSYGGGESGISKFFTCYLSS